MLRLSCSSAKLATSYTTLAQEEGGGGTTTFEECANVIGMCTAAKFIR